MAILDLKNKEQVKRYNEFIKKNGCVTQDLRWGSVKDNWTTEAVYLEENEKIVAAMTVQIRKIIGKYHLIYANRGPVGDIYDIKMLNRLIQELIPIVKKYNAAVLKFDPEVKKDKKLEELLKSNGFIVINDIEDTHNLIQPIYNMILNVDENNIDNLMNRFSSKTRYNIRLAAKKGVSTRWSRDEEDLKKFYELYLITGERDGITCRPYSYFRKMFEAYTSSDELRIYISEYEGKALSAAICFHYNNKTWYIYGASSNELRNLMPNYQMQYEMIKWAIENGSKLYDFGGVFKLNKEDGLFKFKEGFCRKEQHTEYIGEIDKVYNKPVYWLFAKGVPLIKKIKRKFR